MIGYSPDLRIKLNKTLRGGRNKYLQFLIKKAGIPSLPEHRPDLSNPMDSKISASETLCKWNVAFPGTSIKFAGGSTVS
jgi:hypothetical protein